MFAFAIFDTTTGKLFCARDRFGIKPFFYYSDNEKFIFGSEIKAILNYPGIDKSLSADGLESYFTYGYITNGLSAFKHIEKLAPAHTLTVIPGKPEKLSGKKYWELDLTQDHQKSVENWKEEILSCLEETVKLHMISDVPLGAFLSGGIDSSTVVAMMSKVSDRTIKTFSIGFAQNEFNELSYAREIAEKYHTEHYEQVLEPGSVDLLHLLVNSYDEPFADSSAIPTYLVSKFAREHVTVALSGDGGDELFAGYSAYLKMLNITSKNILPNSVNKLVFGTADKFWPEKWPGKGLLYYHSLQKKNIGAYYCLWKQNERDSLFRESFSRQLSARGEAFKTRLLEKETKADFLTKLQYLDVQTYMVDDILTKVDRVSMQNSLEVRVPLLDHVFAELAFSIPSKFKIKKGDKKHILKHSVNDLLTPTVIGHRKQGFAIPLSQWFKADLKMYLQDVLLDANQPLFNYLNKKYVEKQLDNHLNGMRDMSSKLWSLLFFNEWLKQNES